MKNKFLRGWGRCFKVILQTHAPENFRSRRWGAEQVVLFPSFTEKHYFSHLTCEYLPEQS